MKADCASSPDGVIIDALCRLLRADRDDLDEVIAQVLAQTGTHLGAERVCVLLDEGGPWRVSHDWHAPGLEPFGAALNDMPLDDPEFVPEVLFRQPEIVLDDIAALPDSPLRARLAPFALGRVAVVPMLRTGIHAGLLALSRQAPAPPFDPGEIAPLHALADGLFSALSRFRAEAALHEARGAQAAAVERLRATLAALHDLVIEVDEEGRCLDFHCQRPELLATPPESMLGSRIGDRLPPEIAAINRKAMAEAREKGVSAPVEYWLETGGKQRRFRMRAARRGEDGYVLRIADVSDEHAQREQNELLSAVTRNMTNFAQILDESMRIRWSNPAFQERMGVPLKDLIGRRIRDITGPKTSAAAMDAVDKAVAARRPARVTGHRVDRDGKDLWVDISLQPWYDSEGVFRGFISVETDITEQKRHEEALADMARRAEEAHALLTAAIEALDDGFVIFDADDRLVLCNSRYRALNDAVADIIKPGVTMQEIIDTGFARGVYRFKPGRAEEKQRSMRNNLSSQSFEDEDVYADGRVIRVFGTRMPGGGHVGLRTDITERRRAEQRLADIIAGARIGTWDMDLATGIEEVNDLWFHMLGYKRGELPEDSDEKWALLAHPEDNARIKAALTRVIAGESDRLEAEARLRHRKGDWVHVLTRGHVTERGADGRALRMSGIDIDITERRRAEERLSAILEGTSIATWEFDTSIPSASIDENYAAMLGYRLEELTPFSMERFLSLCHPDDAPRMMENTRAAHRRGEETLSNEIRMRHKSGRWTWIMCKTRVHRWGPDGLAITASGINIDINEAHEREAALAQAKEALEEALAERRSAEQRLADIAQITDDWFWESDCEGRFTFISQGFERSTGVPASAVIGRRRRDFSIDGRGASVAELERLEAERRSYTGHVYQLRNRADGGPLHIRVSGTPFHDAKGEFAGYRGVGTDVTALVTAVERAEAANESKSRFLANMSHELRTPLMGVLGMAELLAEGEISDEQREMIDTIRGSGEGLLGILNDLLDLAKIEAGKLDIENRPFAPAALMGRIEAHYGLRARAAGLSLIVQSEGDFECQRLGDPERLLQILHNLVSNAIKFTEAGEVSLTLTAGADRLDFTVRDSGIGMSADQLARVFDEFEQADTRTARRYGGTGLGLSITRRLVSLMGGEITLESEPGTGTTARFGLPAPPTEGTIAEGAPPMPAETDQLAGLRLLVADDNRTNRMILQRMLEGLGCSVTVCDDGQSAVAAFSPGRFDLLLFDIAMPVMDGPTALAAVRAQEQAAGAEPVPALAVTANAMRNQIEEYLAAGFAGHLPKPFRKALLAQAIARHTGAPAPRNTAWLSRRG